MTRALFCAVLFAAQLSNVHAAPVGDPTPVSPAPATTGEIPAPPPAPAVQPEPPQKTDKYLNMSLEELLNKEIVTSGRVKQKLSKSHSSITVITAEDIQRLPATDLAELIKLVVPGIDIRLQYDTFNETTFGARGLTGNVYAKRMLVLLDGRPMNYPVDGDFDIDFRFPLSAVRQIEIIRGPGSSLYGANAFLGVINIITGPPDDSRDGGSVTTRYGQYGTYAASGTGNVKVGDVKVSSSFELMGADEFGTSRKFFHLPSTITDYREGWTARDARVSVEYKGLTLRGGLFADSINQGTRGRNANDPADPSIYTKSAPEKSSFGSLAYDGSVSKVLNVSLQGYVSESQKDEIYSPSQGSPRPWTTTAYVYNDYQIVEHMAGLNGQLAYTPSESVRLLAGGDFVRLASDEKFDPYRAVLNDKRSRQGAVFAEGNYEPFPWLDLVAGGRYDWHSEYDSQFSPRLSALARFMDSKGSLRLSYGGAFRAPNFAEIFPTKAAFPDLVLNPERIRSLELAAAYQAGDVKVAATLFDERMSDTIEYKWDPATGITFYNLNGNQKSKGVELEINALVAKRVRLWSNYCYTDTASDIPDDPYADWLVHAPRHKAQFGASVLFTKFDATLASFWVGKQRDYNWALTGQAPVPGYVAFFAKVNYHVSPKLTFGVTVKNLSNKKYWDKAGEKLDWQGLPTPEETPEWRDQYYPPRTILADLRLRF